MIIRVSSLSNTPSLLKNVGDGQAFKLTPKAINWTRENCRPKFSEEELVASVFSKGSPPPGMSVCGGHNLNTGVQFGFGDGDIEVFLVQHYEAFV